MIDFNLSTQGYELAVSAIAFNAGNIAAAKALGEINAERRAALEPATEDAPAIDRFSDYANSVADDELGAEAREEQGHDKPVGFVEYCVLLAAANDELEKLADGGKWPIPQSVDGILSWKEKAVAQAVKPDQLMGMKAMIAAHSGIGIEEVALSDEELTVLAKAENERSAEQFAEMFRNNREDIKARMEAGMLNYNRFSETSFQTLFNNLPAKVKYNLLGTVDFRLESKCSELLTGRKRDGSLSPAAKRPMLVRAADIALIRKDQKQVAVYRHQLEAQAA